MAEIMAWPLNLAEYAYNAEDIQRWMAGKTSGVYGAEGNWQVIAAGGMNLTVKATDQPGGWLSNMGRYGVVFWNSADIHLTVPTADGTLPRVDRVVVSWHIPQQSSVPTVEVRKGTASSNPAGPALVNDGEYAEICIAEIHLSAGQTEITNQNIIDTRMDEDLCGIVSMGVEKYPTDGLEAEFRDWLSTLQTDLSGDVAANLLNNIETHKSDTTVHLRRLTHKKSGIVHQLAGIGTDQGVISCVFTTAAAYSSGDTFTVDGTAYTVKMQDGKDPTDGFFTSGAIVPVIVDTVNKTVNFKTGGVDISSATASPSDVLAGKTFFSGLSDLIQTGTFNPKDALKIANGSASGSALSDGKITVSGLNFTPVAIVAYCSIYYNGELISAILPNESSNTYRCYNFTDPMDTPSLNYPNVIENGFSLPRSGTSSSYSYGWYAVGI